MWEAPITVLHKWWGCHLYLLLLSAILFLVLTPDSIPSNDTLNHFIVGDFLRSWERNRLSERGLAQHGHWDRNSSFSDPTWFCRVTADTQGGLSHSASIQVVDSKFSSWQQSGPGPLPQASLLSFSLQRDGLVLNCPWHPRQSSSRTVARHWAFPECWPVGRGKRLWGSD